jgi:hypothetical protein
MTARECLRLAVATAGTAALLAACVGPATTNAAYTGKALRTANDALSQVQTARLSALSALEGKLPHAYLETVLSESEDALSSIANAFDSIQPPNSKTADRLRNALDAILSDGTGALAQLRIDARRNDTAAVRADVAQLAPIAAGFQHFTQAH